MRILAVDLGNVRTGIAISDPSGLICRPLAIVEQSDHETLALHIATVAEREDVSTVLVGWPRSLSGRENEQSANSERFARRLEELFEGSVVLWDERFTTKLARRLPKEPGKADDARAACYLLQSYLDAPRATRKV